jgi:hypothetical protein
MLQWKPRLYSLLITLTLVAFAVMNAKGGHGKKFGW